MNDEVKVALVAGGSVVIAALVAGLITMFQHFSTLELERAKFAVEKHRFSLERMPSKLAHVFVEAMKVSEDCPEDTSDEVPITPNHTVNLLTAEVFGHLMWDASLPNLLPTTCGTARTAQERISKSISLHLSEEE